MNGEPRGAAVRNLDVNNQHLTLVLDDSAFPLEPTYTISETLEPGEAATVGFGDHLYSNLTFTVRYEGSNSRFAGWVAGSEAVPRINSDSTLAGHLHSNGWSHLVPYEYNNYSVEGKPYFIAYAIFKARGIKITGSIPSGVSIKYNGANVPSGGVTTYYFGGNNIVISSTSKLKNGIAPKIVYKPSWNGSSESTIYSGTATVSVPPTATPWIEEDFKPDTESATNYTISVSSTRHIAQISRNDDSLGDIVFIRNGIDAQTTQVSPSIGDTLQWRSGTRFVASNIDHVSPDIRTVFDGWYSIPDEQLVSSAADYSFTYDSSYDTSENNTKHLQARFSMPGWSNVYVSSSSEGRAEIYSAYPTSEHAENAYYHSDIKFKLYPNAGKSVNQVKVYKRDGEDWIVSAVITEHDSNNVFTYSLSSSDGGFTEDIKIEPIFSNISYNVRIHVNESSHGHHCQVMFRYGSGLTCPHDITDPSHSSDFDQDGSVDFNTSQTLSIYIRPGALLPESGSEQVQNIIRKVWVSHPGTGDGDFDLAGDLAYGTESGVPYAFATVNVSNDTDIEIFLGSEIRALKFGIDPDWEHESSLVACDAVVKNLADGTGGSVGWLTSRGSTEDSSFSTLNPILFTYGENVELTAESFYHNAGTMMGTFFVGWYARGDTRYERPLSKDGSVFRDYSVFAPDGPMHLVALYTKLSGYYSILRVTNGYNTISHQFGTTPLAAISVAPLDDNTTVEELPDETAFNMAASALSQNYGIPVEVSSQEGTQATTAVGANDKFYKVSGKLEVVISPILPPDTTSAVGGFSICRYTTTYTSGTGTSLAQFDDTQISPAGETGNQSLDLTLGPASFVSVSYISDDPHLVRLLFCSGSDYTKGTFSINPWPPFRGAVSSDDERSGEYKPTQAPVAKAVAKNGYKFAGWFMDPEGMDAYSTSHMIQIPMNLGMTMEFYAKFVSDSFKVYEWEGERENMTLDWRSRRFSAAQPINLVCGSVHADGYSATLRVHHASSPNAGSDDWRTAEIDVEDQDPRRLPMVRPERYVEIEVVSQSAVLKIAASSSMGGLASG